MERRLAAILAADVVGYSRLMEADEEATARTLSAQRDTVEELVTSHNGRVFGGAGDSFIAEFASPVEAVRCAVEIQRGLETHNADLPEDRRMRLRIGINLGDVMIDGDNLLGDGVNIAARLETLADPGGIALAQSVYDQVRKQPGLDCEYLGERDVKNIAEPIMVYRVAAEAGPLRDLEKAPQSSRPMTMAAFVAMLILVTGAAMWLQRSGPAVEVATVENMAYPLPDKPSIAVLPFTNMSGDPEQEYFVDGMTDDLITDLSKVSGLFVVARNSVFVYKGGPVKIATVAEELGVRYVLEGSVRRDGDRVRVNAQLIDATTGGHLWADRYDGDIANIFSVQDAFVGKIVRALEVSLKPDEKEQAARGETNNIEAREAFQKGWEHYLNYTPDENAKAIRYLEEAIGLDPDYGKAYAALTLVYYKGCGWRWNGPLGISTSEAGDKAMYYKLKSEENPSSFGSAAASQINLYFGRFDDALGDAARAIALDPNDPEGYLAMAWSLMTSGNPEASVELVERAVRLNPGYPYHYVFTLGVALIANGDYERAVAVMQDTVDKDERATVLIPPLAAAQALLGRRKEARATLQAWKPEWSPRDLSSFPYSYHFPFEWAPDGNWIMERLKDGLHLAVIPLDVTVPVLITTLANGEIAERREAARSLGLFGPLASEAVPALIDALSNENTYLRSRSIIALGKIGPQAEAAIPNLKALRDDSLVMREATEALERIAGK